VGRRLLAFGLSVALQAGALSAPLVHAHLGNEHDDHHASGRIHAHIEGHPAAANHRDDDRPAVHSEESGERIVPLKLFVATHAGIGLEPTVAPRQFMVTPPASSLVRQPPQVVRSHGPPAIISSTPRAPPFSPVLI
jgi:hypothetical protein